VVVGLVVPAHVLPGHVHGERLAGAGDPVAVVDRPDETGPGELDVAVREGQDVKDVLGGGVDGAGHGDALLVTHPSTLTGLPGMRDRAPPRASSAAVPAPTGGCSGAPVQGGSLSVLDVRATCRPDDRILRGQPDRAGAGHGRVT